MWRIVESSALFRGESYLVQTEDTEETVGTFPEREDAELFLKALERERWCRALMIGDKDKGPVDGESQCIATAPSGG